MKLTQSAAALRAGMSQPNWSAHESGSRPLTAPMLARLSSAIGFRPSIAVRTHRDQIRRICTSYGAEMPQLFGSAAVNRDTVRSDLDILVTAGPGMTMFDIIALESELEALCGVAVDVITTGAVENGGASWSKLEMIAI